MREYIGTYLIVEAVIVFFIAAITADADLKEEISVQIFIAAVMGMIFCGAYLLS